MVMGNERPEMSCGSPPNEVIVLFYEGSRLMDEDEAAAAEKAFRQALAIFPGFAEAHANLGLLLDRNGDAEEAEAHYRRALKIDPQLTQSYLNLGALLERQKRFAEAEAIYRQLLVLEPESPAAWSNLGVLLACMKREAEAEQCYRTAIRLDPAYRKAPFNLAYLLLRQGRFEEGWKSLEAREWYLPLERYLACPRWQGEPLDGKSLLIGYEAGHGDMIQFCRYAGMLRQRGAAKISILCHPGLKPLFAAQPELDEVIAFDEPFRAFGWNYWTPPLSLPFLFETRLENIPADLPYLAADPERIAHYSRVMGDAEGQRRIGLAWRGSPQFENDADRSLPSLATLAPLGELPGIRLFSLQKGAGEDEAAAPPPGLPLVDLAPQIDDFADTAAIIAGLDLVISVDTAVAHLAGALGKPCWLLLPDYKTDWRWLTGRDDSPWYPGVMRLFRQPSPGDWPAVIESVKKALITEPAR